MLLGEFRSLLAVAVNQEPPKNDVTASQHVEVCGGEKRKQVLLAWSLQLFNRGNVAFQFSVPADTGQSATPHFSSGIVCSIRGFSLRRNPHFGGNRALCRSDSSCQAVIDQCVIAAPISVCGVKL